MFLHLKSKIYIKQNLRMTLHTDFVSDCQCLKASGWWGQNIVSFQNNLGLYSICPKNWRRQNFKILIPTKSMVSTIVQTKKIKIYRMMSRFSLFQIFPAFYLLWANSNLSCHWAKIIGRVILCTGNCRL